MACKMISGSYLDPSLMPYGYTFLRARSAAKELFLNMIASGHRSSETSRVTQGE
jgi:hypothetical protein